MKIYSKGRGLTKLPQGHITIDDAADQLKVTRGTLYYYIRTLKLQTVKFPLDRRAYLTMKDFEEIKRLKDEAAERGGGQDVNPAA
ncbi:MAG TPA: hypothetical protein VFA10_11465 [Ktedonobacteraceae bacterium]|nr:hypothetical protein [Ktedonobacteraceae bacterium]